MKFIKYNGLVMACLLAAGCATTGQNGSVPVEDADGTSAGSDPAGQSQQFKIIKNVPPVPPQNSAAVKGLISTAEQQWIDKDYSGASDSLERAIRITPRDAGLYYRLAYVRFAQEDYAQTEQLCKKAISFAASDPGLQARCGTLIARAKQDSQAQ